MKYTPKNSNRESGMALVFAIGLLALLLMIGMAFIGNAVNYRKVAQNNSARSQSRMFALSAVSRAASALMIYAHQYARVPENNNEFPQSFDGIYSYAAYNSDGEVAKGGSMLYNDGLLGSNSLMKVPSSSYVIDARSAMSFNQKFVNDWPGKWVFFTNGQSGEKRRIIGRAAWQVIGAPAELLAPVFMRGHIDGLDPDPDFVPQDNRWGREIDEVYLGNRESIWDSIHNVFEHVGNVLTDKDGKLTDYESIYALTHDADDSEVQRWVEKWFIPDFEEGKTVGDPTAIRAEAYYDGGDSLARFNISELGNGKDWHEDYDVNDGADPWYARFGVDSTISGESGKLNSEESIKLLTQDSLPFSSENGNDSAYAQSGETTGLPVLRRIGNSNGTFADLSALRKQIAANFNDYCDADGMPTSDVPAANWRNSLDDAAVPYVHPLYTGNEKTPYIYELGMNFGLVSGDPAVSTVRAKKDAATGNYRIDLAVKAAPVIKLINIYPFDPAEKANGADLYKEFAADDFMRGYVDFGKLDFKFMIREALFNNVIFSYDVTTQKYKEVTDSEGNKSWEKDGEPVTVTKAFTLDKLTLQKALLDGVVAGDGIAELTKEFNFASGSWRRREVGTDGVSAVEPVIFSGNDLKNTDGSKPYPVKISSDKNDKMWQIALCKSETGVAHPMDFALTAKIEDFFVKDGTPDTGDATAVDKNGLVLGSKVDGSGDGSMDEFRYAFGSRKSETVNGAEKTETTYGNAVINTPESVDIETVEMSESSLEIGGFRRAVLTANIPVSGNAAVEAGVDYVKELPALPAADITAKFNTADRVINLNPGTDSAPKNVPGFVIGAYRNRDPRQNLNVEDWISFANIERVEDFVKPDAAKIESVMCIAGGAGKVNEGGSDTWSPKNYDDAEGAGILAKTYMDWEQASEPAYLGKNHDKHISTAVIRNAPMMSPWEIGFIHRGVLWQTINLKKSHTPSGFFNDNGDNWGTSGSGYTEGDAAIFEQIKMTDKTATYGKINVNMLSHKFANFSELDHGIIKALFMNLQVNEDPAVFIHNSTRGTDGKFLALEDDTESMLIDESFFDGSKADIVANFTRDVSRKNSGKLNFLNYKDTVGGVDRSLGNAFCDYIWERQQTDAAQEEIIGKTINLLDASTPSPSVINMIVVAQSIRDVDGEQIRKTDEVSGFTDLDGATVESDGIVTKECKYGRFDFLKHDSDHGKNIYFDEITGETKIFVRVYINEKGRMIINRIHYL